MTDPKFLRLVFLVNAVLPAVLMAFDWQQGNLGANPIEFITRATGVLALVFMVLTLMVTPLRKLFHLNWLLKQRRLLGLVAFFYAAAHFLTYLAFDRDWRLTTVPADVWQRPFIMLGLLSFLLMVPLAATSTNAMIKKLGGKKWNRLHRLTYYIAIGGVLHYYLIVKSDTSWPLLFGFAVAVLLGYRTVVAARRQEG
jgi:sulfoxide reductase heme-binding subunit YedZ